MTPSFDPDTYVQCTCAVCSFVLVCDEFSEAQDLGWSVSSVGDLCRACGPMTEGGEA